MAQDQDAFRRLAVIRLGEAELLLSNQLASGAYYLAGYAVECALKAKIATQFRANAIPDKALVNRVHDHDLNRLLQLANLSERDYAALTADPVLRRSWAIAAKWKPDARYQHWSMADATDLVGAIGGEDGLLQWLLKL